MSRFSRAIFAVAVAGLAVAGLTSCATPAASDDIPPTAPFGTGHPAPPDGEVSAQGLVLDTGGEVQLCLGAVAESYPPQCDGLAVVGWSWEGLTDYSESSAGVRWGSFAVQGTWDGETFTVTDPAVPLALYDPMPFEDATGGEAGAASEERLAEIQQELFGRLGDDFLMSSPERGYLIVDVVWDDGTYQDAADAEYGDDIVVVRSAMRLVDGG